jgi:RHS repeat-associated protein
VASYGHDVFGAIRSQSGSSDNYWLFTGEQLDSDEGLYYLRARYYDPETGRFLSQDPLPLGNLYAYVGNNPVNRVDPSGLMHIADVGGVRPKEGGGFDFDRLCPNRDPNRIYIIDDGVCYDITPDPCEGALLCGSGESGLFGFQPEKPLSDVWDFVNNNRQCVGYSALVGVEVFFIVDSGGTSTPVLGPQAIQHGTFAILSCSDLK